MKYLASLVALLAGLLVLPAYAATMRLDLAPGWSDPPRLTRCPEDTTLALHPQYAYYFADRYVPPAGHRIGSVTWDVRGTKGVAIYPVMGMNFPLMGPYWGFDPPIVTTQVSANLLDGSHVQRVLHTFPAPLDSLPTVLPGQVSQDIWSVWNVIRTDAAVNGSVDTMTVLGGTLWGISGERLDTLTVGSGRVTLIDQWPQSARAAMFSLSGPATVVAGDHFDLNIDLLNPGSGVRQVSVDLTYSDAYIAHTSAHGTITDGTSGEAGCLFNGTCGNLTCDHVYSVTDQSPGAFTIGMGSRCHQPDIHVTGQAMKVSLLLRSTTPPGTATTVHAVVRGVFDFEGRTLAATMYQSDFIVHAYDPNAVGGDPGGDEGEIHHATPRILAAVPATYFDISGRKLAGKPSQRGVYFVRHGSSEAKRLVIIK